MKTRFFALLMLLAGIQYLSVAQVSLSATSGTPTGSYTMLREAFAKINDGTHQGDITITLTDATAENATAVLYGSGTGGSSYSSVLIYPTVSGAVISGNIGGPLIDLNGADNVTIDGRLEASGVDFDLAIRNTSTGGGTTSAIRFVNGATGNTVRYCSLQGSSVATDGGIVIFYTSTDPAGNSSNLLEYNDITNAGGNRPQNAVYSRGSSGAPNVSNTVSNNSFHDFLGTSGNTSCGIILATNMDAYGYNSGWTITGNSFYETGTFAPNNGGGYHFIYVNTCDGETSYGDNFTITGNYIGGNAPGCEGTFIKSNGNNGFWGIHLQVGTAVASSIQGNVIRNMKYFNTGAVDWWGIYIDRGAANIGTATPNYIGSDADTGSIFYSCNGWGARFLAFHLQCSGPCNVSNNIVGSVTTANMNSETANSFYGFHQQARGSTSFISNNTIGSATTAGSIQALSHSTMETQRVIGMDLQGNPATITVSGNTVANLVNGTTNTDPSVNGKTYGIYAWACTNTITGNTVHDLTNANSNTSTGPLPWNNDNTSMSVAGIAVSVNGNYVQSISGNTVYNLSNSCPSFSGSVAGIYLCGVGSAVNQVKKNFVYGLEAAEGSSAKLYGIQVAQGVSVISNNIVTLGGTTPATLYGISESGGPNYQANSVYYNTVCIGGSPASGGFNSYALFSALNASTRDIRNNILDNARSNAGASGKHYAVYFPYTGGNLTCDYNDYYVSGTGGMTGYYGGDKSELPVVTGVTGNDAHSQVQIPGFASPGGTTPGSYFPSTPLLSETGTGITDDFDGTTRSVKTEMGAYEVPVPDCMNPTSGGTVAEDQSICTGFAPAAFTSTALPSGYAGGTPEYKWQSSVTGASSGFGDLAASNSPTYTSGVLTATTWFRRLARVSCSADWTGAQASNVVQVTVSQPVPFTPPTVASLSATGTDVKWYAAASGGSPLASTVQLTDGTHYYASQTIDGIESLNRLDVTAVVEGTPCPPTGSANQTFAAGATVSNLSATGSLLRWYSAATGGSALPASTVLTTSTDYYASQTVNCIESARRLKVTVTVE